MTKKFVSMFLALAMCLSLSVTAFAVNVEPYSNIERYAPAGGTYLDFNKPNVQGVSFLRYHSWTYVPAKEVLDWAVGTTPGAVASILEWGAAGWVVDRIAEQLSKVFGLSIPGWWISALLVTGEIASYVLFDMSKDEALNALNDGPGDGILVRVYLDLSFGSPRIIKSYESWNNYPYVDLYPNGGTASWYPGDYNGIGG